MPQGGVHPLADRAAGQATNGRGRIGVFFYPLMYRHYLYGKAHDLVFFGFCLYTFFMDTKRLGRPPKGSDKIKSIRLDMRLNEAEKEGFRAAAELSGLDLSAWIRERLRQVAWKELEKAGRPVPFIENKQ